jgi:hemolysin activation/secretion protein
MPARPCATRAQRFGVFYLFCIRIAAAQCKTRLDSNQPVRPLRRVFPQSGEAQNNLTVEITMRPRHARLLAASILAVSIGSAYAADGDAASPRFDITRFEIAGNTLLTPAQADAAVAPYVGKQRDFADVQAALEALEAAYHARGYKVVSVRLPEQELNQGVVRLNVVQAKIGRVIVSGNQFFDEANVRRSLPTLETGKTPNLNDVSASLRMANENPARKIKLSLQDASADDQVDATLAVADEKPWKVMFNLDNTGNESTGKTHAGVVLQHANLWGRDHVGSFQYTTTVEEPSKVSVYGLGYHIPLYLLGDSVDLFASYSNIDSGSISAGLFDLAVNGKGAMYGVRYNHTLERRGELDARLIFGADIKAFKNSVLFAGQNFGNDITVRPLSVAYTASRPITGGDVSESLTLVHNIAGGSRGGSEDFARTRVGAKPAYTIVRFGAAITHTVAREWQARALLNGQYTRDALVPGEQFGIGGSTSVRGMEERNVATDSGLAANLELYSPNLCTAQGKLQCRALGFVDAAKGSRNHALPGEPERMTATSTGLGLRMTYGTSLNLQLDYGHVLHAGAGTGTGDKNKLHFRMGFAY